MVGEPTGVYFATFLSIMEVSEKFLFTDFHFGKGTAQCVTFSLF
jgi:hypothetical protein